MPFYLVRWPNVLSVSLVKARDKTDLIDILDEVGDTEYCKIKEYRGPVFISLDLDVKYEEAEAIERSIKDASNVAQGPKFHISGDVGDTITEMESEIIKFGFPAYKTYLEKYWKRHLDDDEMQDVSDKEKLQCKTALQKDLKEVKGDWVENSVRWADAYGILDIESNPPKNEDGT